MHSTHRRKLVRDLMQIARDARRLDRLPLPKTMTDSADEAALLAASRRCAAVCADVLPVILDEVPVGAPERRFVHDMLKSLTELGTWHLAETAAAEAAMAGEEAP